MDAIFWQQKWQRGEIAFHEGEANRLLTEHFGKLDLAQGSCVFLPLCGKTRDAAWLLTHYSARNIGSWVGDIFEVTADHLGPVNAIYDRAALVALPAHMREHYTSQLMHITSAAPQLLISYEYNQQSINRGG